MVVESAGQESTDQIRPITTSKIIIDDDKIEDLFLALQRHVQDGYKNALHAILTGNENIEPIVVTDRPANSLAYVFIQAHEAGYIANDKAEIMRWLMAYFQITRKNNIHPVTRNSILDVFYKGKKPSKSKRIIYKP